MRIASYLKRLKRDPEPPPADPNAMLVGSVDQEAFERARQCLEGEGLQVAAEEQAKAALGSLSHRRYDLIVSTFPLPDMILGDFVLALRHRSNPCRDTPLLLLTDLERRAEARRGASYGPCRVLSRSEGPLAMRSAVRQLLELEPRRPVRAPVKVQAPPDQDTRVLHGTVINLSSSGMLLEHRELLPVRTRCRFQFELGSPPLPYAGTGEVVRHSSPRRERTVGFALRFLTFDTGDPEQLRHQLVGAG